MGRRAVILAGGKGSRLGPYTTVLPKPLLPIGDRAILDVVVHQLRDARLHRPHARGRLPRRTWCGPSWATARRHGVNIDYHEEDEPLGTVGPLATIDGLDDTFLVMNGDVLTALDYGAPRGRPHARRATCSPSPPTAAWCAPTTACCTSTSDAGETRVITGFEEKPEIPYVVSMGVYVLEPAALEYIEPGSAPRPARPRAAPARRRRARSAPTSSRATGSTSGATRTTRRRSSSSSRSALLMDESTANERPGTADSASRLPPPRKPVAR